MRQISLSAVHKCMLNTAVLEFVTHTNLVSLTKQTIKAKYKQTDTKTLKWIDKETTKHKSEMAHRTTL